MNSIKMSILDKNNIYSFLFFLLNKMYIIYLLLINSTKKSKIINKNNY